MAMGRRNRDPQPSMWVATMDLPAASHPFYARLNQVLRQHGFDDFAEAQCAEFSAETMGRPSLPPGIYFRLLLIGYFEGLDSERGIAWRAADSFALRDFLGVGLESAPPDHSTISRTRRLIDLDAHRAVFTLVLQCQGGAGLVKGKTSGIDATTLEANARLAQHRAARHGRDVPGRSATCPASDSSATRFGRSSAVRTRTCPTRRKNGLGSVWTWTAIDADTKLIASWLVGSRDAGSAYEFMQDVAGRLRGRVQLTTDGHRPYLEAVEAAFGMDIDYAVLQKMYGAEAGSETRYSAAVCIGCKQENITGSPDPKHISTSYVERQNLTMRMSCVDSRG